MTRTPAALAAIAITLATSHAAAAAGTPVPSGVSINGPGLPPVVVLAPTRTPTSPTTIGQPTPAPAGVGPIPEQPIRLPRTGQPSTVAGYGVLATMAALLLRRRSAR